MKDAFPKAIVQGVADELYAARAFLWMAERSTDIHVKVDFTRYAAEEAEHARVLLSFLEELFDHQPLALPEVRPIEEEDVMSFLIQYRAREEAAIFYYKSLIELTEIEAHRAIFRQILSEEEHHFGQLQHLIDRQLARMKEAQDV